MHTACVHMSACDVECALTAGEELTIVMPLHTHHHLLILLNKSLAIRTKFKYDESFSHVGPFYVKLYLFVVPRRTPGFLATPFLWRK